MLMVWNPLPRPSADEGYVEGRPGIPSKDCIKLLATGRDLAYPLALMAELDSGDEARYGGLDTRDQQPS